MHAVSFEIVTLNKKGINTTKTKCSEKHIEYISITECRQFLSKQVLIRYHLIPLVQGLLNNVIEVDNV